MKFMLHVNRFAMMNKMVDAIWIIHLDDGSNRIECSNVDVRVPLSTHFDNARPCTCADVWLSGEGKVTVREDKSVIIEAE